MNLPYYAKDGGKLWRQFVDANKARCLEVRVGLIPDRLYDTAYLDGSATNTLLDRDDTAFVSVWKRDAAPGWIFFGNPDPEVLTPERLKEAQREMGMRWRIDTRPVGWYSPHCPLVVVSHRSVKLVLP